MAKSATPNDTRKNQLLNSSGVDIDASKATNSKYIIIDRMGLSSLNLLISYGSIKDSTGISMYEAYSSITGLIGGHEWEPGIIVNKTSQPKRFNYYVDGMLEWKLFGIRFYLEPKHYTGSFDIP